MARPRRFWLVVTVLLGLLSLAQVQYGLTVVGAVWWTVLSWDSSATHEFETLSSLTPPSTDPTRQAREHTVPAATPLRRLPLPENPPAPAGIELSGRITRSPPEHRVV